jgi:PAS domain S-box-containing protein
MQGLASDEVYRALFEGAPDAVVVIDTSACIVAANPRAERMFGYPADALRGRSIEMLVPERFRGVHARDRDAYLVDPTPRPMGTGLDLWGRHRDGSEFPVEISLSPVRYLEQTFVSAAIRDVTARKREQDQMRKARDELEDRVRERSAQLAAQVAERKRADEQLRRQGEMLDLVSEPIFAWDTQRGIIFWNKAAAEVYGYASDDALGHVSHTLLATEHSLGIAHLREALERDGRWSGELTHTTRDGRRIIVECRMTMMAMASGEQIVLESCRDITGRLANEEVVRQLQKMEALGQLTGGIAHDFNNLLTVISANLQMLEDELPPSSLASDLAASAARAARRGADLTRKLLIFARRQRLEATAVDLNKLISNISAMLTRTLGEHIRIANTLDANVPRVLVDGSQLETALLNLAVNARDAMPGGGHLSFVSGTATLDDAPSAGGNHGSGTYGFVSVSDTGIGMTEDVLARAFEPFFTTKVSGKGTGLGLSIVYGFARQSGGHVSLRSEPGRGTTVTLYLPLATDSETEIRATRDERPAGGETILLVENDDEVRTATHKLLAGLGYRVVEATDAATALALLGKNRDVRLLLTDVVLAPGMSGPELARDALELRPKLKVVFMSGYVPDAVAYPGQLERDEFFLSKPFRREDLTHVLRRALDSADD